MRIMFTELLENKELVIKGLPDDDLAIFDRPLRKEELSQAAKGAEILSVFIYTDVRKEVIEQLPDLKMIITRSVGFDHIDAKYALDKGIEVCHVPDYGAHVVAEHAFALLLAAAKNVVRADSYVKSGRRFDFEPFLGTELKDKTIGVIGTGKIGAVVIHMAKGFGMRVVAFDVYHNLPLAERYGFNYMSLEELLAQSDFITLHIPSTPETHHLINADSISRMKKGAVLVNAARGGLVDSQALKAGLESGHIAAAAVDVLEEEDDPGNDPLLNAPNIVITPHSAFFTKEALERIARTTLEIIESYKKGKILNRVPTEYL